MGTWPLGQKVQAVSCSDDSHTRNNAHVYVELTVTQME